MRNQGWPTVSVFLSSTFNDMHAERDYLVKRVFPRLRDWCEQRRLRFVDIDLRWGVTEADATRNKRVVEVCLKRIDECRPFFICLLGQRCGWLPTRNDLPGPEASGASGGSLSSLDWSRLREAVDEGRSVTELEVMHALLEPFQRKDAPDALRLPAEHAFFYLRDDSYLPSLPAIPAALRPPGAAGMAPEPLRWTYTDEDEEDLKLRQLKAERLAMLRKERVPQTGRPARVYSARWNASARTPELEIPVDCPFDMGENLESVSPGAARWQKLWQKWAGVKAAGPSVVETDRDKAQHFNEWLTTGRLTDFACRLDEVVKNPPANLPKPAGALLENGLAELRQRFPDGRVPLGEVIGLDLMAAIAARHSERMALPELDDLQREIDQHEEFVAAAAEGFIPRTRDPGRPPSASDDFDPLDRYVAGKEKGLLAVVAPAGLGKSTLLAAWVQHRQSPEVAGERLLYRFIGVGDRSGTVDSLLRNVLAQLKEEKWLPLDAEVPDDPRELRRDWVKLLGGGATSERLVLVLDALNQLDSGLSDVDWLPRELPPGVRLVISFKIGEKEGDDLRQRLAESPENQVEELKPFEHVQDRRAVVNAWLARYLKELDERHVDALVGADQERPLGSLPSQADNRSLPPASNPLYLKIVLSELRVFGAFGQLGQRIATKYGGSPVSAFTAVLKRLEDDPADSAVPFARLVPLIFGLLAHSRGGLPEDFLADILLDELSPELDRTGMSPDRRRLVITDAVQVVLRQVRPFLARREGRTDFFYESFRIAARDWSTMLDADDPRSPSRIRSPGGWHALLARQCGKWREVKGASERYALANAVQHHLGAGGIAEAVELLTEFEYHYHRLRVLGPTEVSAMAADFAHGRLASSDLETDVASALAAWDLFFTKSLHLLRREHPLLKPELTLLQGAYAHADESPVSRGAEAWLAWSGPATPWLRRVGRPKRIPKSHCLATIEGIRGEAVSVAFNADGTRVVSLSWDSSDPPAMVLMVWDLETGRCIHTEAFSGAGSELAPVPGTDRVVLNLRVPSHPGQKSLDRITAPQVLDPMVRSTAVTFSGHTLSVTWLVVSPDGRRMLSGALDRTIREWDLETGQCLQVIEGGIPSADTRLHAVRRPAFFCGGRWLALKHADHHPWVDVEVWDVSDGRTTRTLGRAGGRDDSWGEKWFSLVAVTSDERTVLVASGSRIAAWDWPTGKCRWSRTFDRAIISLAIDRRGRWAVWGDGQSGVAAIELSTGVIRRLGRHLGGANWLDTHPDGCRAVSAGLNGTLKVWTVEGVFDADMEEARAEDADWHTDSVNAVGIQEGQPVAVSGGCDNRLGLWDAASGRRLATGLGDSDTRKAGMTIITEVAFDIGARTVLTTSAQDPLQEFQDVEVRESGLRSWDLDVLSSGPASTPPIPFTVHVEIVQGGAGLVTTNSDRWGHGNVKAVNLWERRSVAPVRSLSMRLFPPVTSLGASLHGSSVVLGHKDGSLTVWDAASGAVKHRLGGHSEAVSGVCVKQRGDLAISASRDHTLRISDLHSGECLAVLRGHTEEVGRVAAHWDGAWAVSSGAERLLVLWDLARSDAVAAWPADTAIRCVDASATRIVAGGTDGEVLFLEPLGPGPWSPGTAAAPLVFPPPTWPKRQPAVPAVRVAANPGSAGGRAAAASTPAPSGRRASGTGAATATAGAPTGRSAAPAKPVRTEERTADVAQRPAAVWGPACRHADATGAAEDRPPVGCPSCGAYLTRFSRRILAAFFAGAVLVTAPLIFLSLWFISLTAAIGLLGLGMVFLGPREIVCMRCNPRGTWRKLLLAGRTTAAAWHPDAPTLAVSCDEGTVVVLRWDSALESLDLNNVDVVKTGAPVSAVQWSECGRVVLCRHAESGDTMHRVTPDAHPQGDAPIWANASSSSADDRWRVELVGSQVRISPRRR